MKIKIGMCRIMLLLGILILQSGITNAQEFNYTFFPENEADSMLFSRRITHRVGVEFRPEYIFQTNAYVKGENEKWKPIRNSFSGHLKYSFQYYPNTCLDRIYGGAYQGIGLAYYNFREPESLGNPFAVYLFQGARIARITPRLSLNYEWNLGLSGGWKPYDPYYNSYNIMMGSEVNAYINANFYFNWMLSREIDFNIGANLTHFSNGNTKIPNAGLNTVGLKVGVAYNFNRDYTSLPERSLQTPIPQFPRHISYDLTLFGSWRRKGVDYGDTQVLSPHAYTVLGFNFAPMYNFGYKFRAGVSLDGVYDGSANVYTSEYYDSSEDDVFRTPSLDRQLALGVSGRAEYVMPYFTVGIGLGANVIHGGGDLESFYQILALKIEMTRNSFLHIGYSLHNFHTPRFLMLGIGYRFNNKYPSFHRKRR